MRPKSRRLRAFAIDIRSVTEPPRIPFPNRMIGCLDHAFKNDINIGLIL
jgi:hypothetical protein